MDDAHSVESQRRTARHPRIWLLSLHRVEWAHAIAQHVFRGAISALEAAQFYSAFETDRKLHLFLEQDTPERAFDLAVEFARKHVPTLGCRTLDTLHVASALELGADEFWSFDGPQKKLARAVGLKVS
jgi:predicted nucleic acid-binding protein